MTVNVRGRNIEIDDKLAREYERYFFEPLGERTLLTYFALAGREVSQNLCGYTDNQLSRIANDFLDRDIETWRKDS
jgi:hypothetical protein